MLTLQLTGIELVKLANRIEALRMQEDDDEEAPNEADVPRDSLSAADKAVNPRAPSPGLKPPEHTLTEKRSLSKLAKSAIFREVSRSYLSAWERRLLTRRAGCASEGPRHEGGRGEGEGQGVC